MTTKYTSVEVCAGAGGQALGLEQAGFEHEALVEYDPHACATLRANRPSWNIIQADLRELDLTELVDGHVDLLAGGVPCQPFTISGQQLGAADERDLIPVFLDAVEALTPSAVMMENVPGLLSDNFRPYQEQIRQRLKELGYVVVMWAVLPAAGFGVPQLRPRSVLVALKPEYADRWVSPQPLPDTEYVTVGEALAESMRARGLVGDGLETWRSRANKVAPTLVGDSKKHGGADLGPTRAKQAWAKLGVNAASLANDNDPAVLVDEKGRGPRLTVAQAALLQGFPPAWQFIGPETSRSNGKTARYRQVGNAFPPPVAQAVGEQIVTALRGTEPQS